MSPVSHIVPKTLRSPPLCSQNFWLLVKIEGGGFDENRSVRSRRVPKNPKDTGPKNKFGFSAIFSI